VGDPVQIGELSARSGATVRMLRYYEEQGLLRPGRTGSGYRVFAETDLERVRYIRCLLASALPSTVVRQTLAFLDGELPAVPTNIEECRPLVDVLQGQLDDLDERITVLRRSREQLALFVGDVRGQLADDVYLREVREGDLDDLFEHQNDPEANTMAGFPARDRGAFTAYWAQVLADDSVDKRTILAEGRIVGNIVTFERGGRREVGYWLGRRFWGRGFATKALAEFLRQVKTRPLYASTVPDNTRSQRVLEKCGFTRLSQDGEVVFRIDKA
jgi:RimJ/RimL family protein N-acetyltransferase